MDKKDYEVGYKKPPQEHQFKSGLSGNNKGRPKEIRNTYNLLNEILDQKIDIKENGIDFKISKKIAMLTQLVNKGIKGDIKAINTLLPHMLIADAKEEDKAKILSAVSNDDKKIITNYLKNLSDFDGVEEIANEE